MTNEPNPSEDKEVESVLSKLEDQSPQESSDFTRISFENPIIDGGLPRKFTFRNRAGYELAEVTWVASGGLGGVYDGILKNPLQLVTERVFVGEKDPGIILGDDFQENPVDENNPVEITNPDLIKRIAATAEEEWKRISSLSRMDMHEQCEAILKIIDPRLIENRRIAVKVLKRLQTTHNLEERVRDTERRFLQEAHNLKQFEYPNDHPNIARRYGMVKDPIMGNCLVLEFIEGKSLLDHRMSQEGYKLRYKEATMLMEELASAVRHMQSRGITHRDLKPHNILMRNEGGRLVPVIVDFGMSKDETQVTHGAIAGTPQYLSPEQARGKFDERIDVYGLATIFVELITGRPAYIADNLDTVLHMVREPEHPWLVNKYCPDISESLFMAIEKGRAKNVKERSTIEEFLVDLKEINSHGSYYKEAVTITPPSTQIIRAELKDVTKQAKHLVARRLLLETEVRYRDVEEQITKIEQLLDESKYTEANEKVLKIARILNDGMEQPEEITKRYLDITKKLEAGMRWANVRKHLTDAHKAKEEAEHMTCNDLLIRVERIFEENAKKLDRSLRDEYETLIQKFPERDDVSQFTTYRNTSFKKIYDAWQTLEETMKKRQQIEISTEDISKVLTAAEERLEKHDPKTVGKDHERVKKKLYDIKEYIPQLQHYIGLYDKLRSIHNSLKTYEQSAALSGPVISSRIDGSIQKVATVIDVLNKSQESKHPLQKIVYDYSIELNKSLQKLKQPGQPSADLENL